MSRSRNSARSHGNRHRGAYRGCSWSCSICHPHLEDRSAEAKEKPWRADDDHTTTRELWIENEIDVAMRAYDEEQRPRFLPMQLVSEPYTLLRFRISETRRYTPTNNKSNSAQPLLNTPGDRRTLRQQG